MVKVLRSASACQSHAPMMSVSIVSAIAEIYGGLLSSAESSRYDFGARTLRLHEQWHKPVTTHG
jgi:hypothetical protein